MSDEGIVGNALNLVRDALNGPLSERMILVDYDRLLAKPAETMALLYKFLREDEFAHDFNDFAFDLPGLDAFLNTPGLHSIRGPLRPATKEMLLPPDMARELSKRAVWTKPTRTSAVMLLAEKGGKSPE